jgi:hypothetical protein
MTSILAPYRPTPPPPASSSALRRPGNLLCPDGIIFENMERAVQRHLFQLHVLDGEHPRPPRFLVIAGKPGTGKTVAATDAALRMNHAVLHLPASNLASENEGGATAALDSYLADAEQHARTHNEPVAIIADDLDLGIISAEADTGRTINSNLLVQRLQSLADGDDIRNADGTRIALIVTGNDWSTVRQSLFRDGRAAWYEHAPTQDDIARLALNLFKPRTDGDRRLLLKLAHRYRHESVAFWSAVRTGLNNDLIDALMAAGITDPTAIKVELHRPRPLEPGKLLVLARKHATRRRLSFL